MTGVQTCALPIYTPPNKKNATAQTKNFRLSFKVMLSAAIFVIFRKLSPTQKHLPFVADHGAYGFRSRKNLIPLAIGTIAWVCVPSVVGFTTSGVQIAPGPIIVVLSMM